MEDKITITLTDKVVEQLEKMDIDPDTNKKLKIWQLKKLKEKAQAELSDINAELDELRK